MKHVINKFVPYRFYTGIEEFWGSSICFISKMTMHDFNTFSVNYLFFQGDNTLSPIKNHTIHCNYMLDLVEQKQMRKHVPYWSDFSKLC